MKWRRRNSTVTAPSCRPNDVIKFSTSEERSGDGAPSFDVPAEGRPIVGHYTAGKTSMTERRREVGACGMHCAGCLDYRALAMNDEELRNQAAATINKETGRNLRPDEVGCEGCWGSVHEPWCATLECKVRQCVNSKGFATCGDCQGFPCATYLAQFGEQGDHARNIREIRAVGLMTWLESKRRGAPPPA
jgi:hypothetical protein